ncbi:TPA: hypothetical protein ACH3X1_003908 [Trebouxia sp. C0004]
MPVALYCYVSSPGTSFIILQHSYLKPVTCKQTAWPTHSALQVRAVLRETGALLRDLPARFRLDTRLPARQPAETSNSSGDDRSRGSAEKENDMPEDPSREGWYNGEVTLRLPVMLLLLMLLLCRGQLPPL